MAEKATIKRNDSADLIFTLGLDLDVYDAARVIIGRPGQDAIVDREGEIDGQTVTITLTPEETATEGTYEAEVEMSPGPHTYPTTAHVHLEIRPDLG